MSQKIKLSIILFLVILDTIRVFQLHLSLFLGIIVLHLSYWISRAQTYHDHFTPTTRSQWPCQYYSLDLTCSSNRTEEDQISELET